MVNTISLQLFQQFFSNYRYILFEELIDYYALFGGIETDSLELYNPLDEVITTLVSNDVVKKQLPFFLFEKPFRDFLIALAKSDGKIDSLFRRLKMGQSLGEEIVNELVSNGIIFKVESREPPFKLYPKQLVKKELRTYKIEAKLYFTRPFYRFWFAFIEPYFSKERKADMSNLLNNFTRERYRLSSAVFEDLSNVLLKLYFQERDPIIENGSLWNYHSEFDIYAKTKSGKVIIGECKYRNRPIAKSELIKLESKAEQSAIKVDIYTLFSKSGFSKEFEKSNQDNLLLFTLDEFKKLLL